ncbi:DUF1801 domain-containing protein [bacterium]|nr:DUF1801 domain-containing protein [bacterium]
MTTSQNKTQPTDQKISEYLDKIDKPERRADAEQLIKIMSEATGEKPVLWGPSMVGFGSYHYKYPSGREGDALKVGFAMRKPKIVLYGLKFYDQIQTNEDLLSKLGPVEIGKGCIYIKSLADIDVTVLKEMIRNAYHYKLVQES